MHVQQLHTRVHMHIKGAMSKSACGMDGTVHGILTCPTLDTGIYPRVGHVRIPWTVPSIPRDCRRTVGRDGRLGHGGRMGGCMGIPRTVLPRDSTIPRNSVQSHGT